MPPDKHILCQENSDETTRLVNERCDTYPNEDNVGFSQSSNSSVGNSKWKGILSVVILCFINLINYIDRYTIAGVLTDVQEYFKLRDAEVGLLQTSFIVSYMMMAPIFGYLGDRYSRKVIIMIGVTFWSITTFLGSLISNHDTWLFFLLRALVGTGEASYSTIAPTIIADLFTGPMRTRMLALFYFAIPVGSGLGYIVGFQAAALFGEWQWALRVTPVLGLVSVVVTFCFLKEPRRGVAEGVHLTNTTVCDDLKYIFKNCSFMWSSLGFTCVSFAAGALSWWVPSYIEYALKSQGRAADKDKVTLVFGSITCFAGIFGVLLGSVGSQKFRQYSLRADPLLCAGGVLISAPLIFMACLFVNKYTSLCYVLMFFSVMFLCMNWPIVADMLLYVIIPTRRSMAEAVQIMMCHALGDASSPYIVGAISDSVTADKQIGATPSSLVKYYSLQYAMFLLPFVMALGGLCFVVNSWYIAEDKSKCEGISHGITSSESGPLLRNANPVEIIEIARMHSTARRRIQNL